MCKLDQETTIAFKVTQVSGLVTVFCLGIQNSDKLKKFSLF